MKKSKEDMLFDGILYAVATLLIILMLYPMYFIVIASFSDATAVANGNITFIPKGINLDGYKRIFEYKQLWVGYKNTIIYTAVGTLINLLVNITAGYAISRKDLVGRKFFTIFYLIPMFFTGGLIPTYLIVKDFHLLDTLWVMVLPFSVVTYYIIVSRTFFANNLTAELQDAAQIDGCGNMMFFLKIVLPLSKAVIAVIALWSAVGHWNSYFNALIYLRDEARQPLQIVLRNILISNQSLKLMTTGSAANEAMQTAELMKYGIIVVSSAPIMMLYPFVQKYFNQGVMLGSVKG